MSSEKDVIFGNLCVQQGYLTPEQLSEVVDAQKAAADLGMDLSVADVLVSKKIITREQREEVMRVARVHTGEAHVVGEYEVISKIGEGGMGVVYKARSTSSGGLVALKVLPPALARNSDLLRRFQREAELTKHLEHENVVRCVEFGLDRERKLHYCALEFIEGEDVAKVLARQGKFPERRALEIVRDIARALDHATTRGLVHRDVKPQNIMIMPNGTPKLLDLGLARSVGDQDTRLTQTGMFVGSPHYASPEQARGEREQDVRTDIYSLGATLYHMVTGETPFPGETAAAVLAKVVSEDLPWPSQMNTDLSDGVSRIIEKMLARSPDDRYATPAALISDIDTHLGGGPVAPLAPGKSVVARPGHPVRRARRGTAAHAPVESRSPGGRTGMYVAAVAGLAILAAAGAFLLLGGPPDEPDPAPAPVAKPEPAPPTPAEPEPDREGELKEMLAYAESYAGEHPADFAAVISNFEKVCVRGRGTRFELEADQKVRDAKMRWREAALAALEERKAAAAQLAERGDYDAALAKLTGLPPGLSQQVTRERRAEADRLRAEAGRRIDGALAEAKRLLDEGDVAGARAALDSLASIRLADANDIISTRVGTLRARADRMDEQRETVAARRATAELPRILNEFDALTGKGDYAKAHALVARAAQRKALAGVAGTLSAAARVAKALEERQRAVRSAAEALAAKREKVSLRTSKGVRKGEVKSVDEGGITLVAKMIINGQVRGATEYPVPWTELAPEEEARLARGWQGVGPDADVARAMAEVSRGRAEEATKALEPAKEHPLAARVRARIDVLRMGAADGAAMTVWRQIEGAAGGRLSIAQAKALLGRIEAFEKEHGRTEFFASLGAKFAELRSRVEEGIYEWVDVPPAKIPVHFTGAGRNTVEGDALVVRAAPGPQSHAQVTFAPNSRDFRARFEYASPALEFFVRKTNWRGAILCLIAPKGVSVRTYPTEDQNAPLVVTKVPRPRGPVQGWHRVEIAAKGKTLTLALDGKVITRTDDLPVAGIGDAHILVWPQGGGLRIRNLRYLIEEPTSGVTTGILAARSRQFDWIDVRADGEAVERRYVPVVGADGAFDRKTQALIKTLVVPNLVNVSWKLHDWRPRIVAAEMVIPRDKQGTITGTVLDKGKEWFDLRPERGPTERYMPQWTGGMPADGGGLEKRILRLIGALAVGQKAKVNWFYEMRRRAMGIESLGAAAGPAGPGIAPGIKFRHDFDKDTQGWFVARFAPNVVGDLSIATRPGLSRRGRGALALTHKLEIGKMPIIACKVKDINHVSLYVRAMNRPAQLVFAANEQDGSSYNTTLRVEPREGWRRLDLDLDTFKLGDDSKDENAVMDFDQVDTFAIVDIAALLGGEGENVILIDDVVGEFRVAEPPDRAPERRR